MFFSLVISNILLALIPTTILSTLPIYMEDKWTKQQMERERLEHEHWVEKQLLTERVNKSKLEEIKKQLINNKEKESLDED